MAVDHFQAHFEPSEVTGHGTGGVAGLGGVVLVGAAPSTWLYLSLVWGGFTSAMAELSERTMRARGQGPQTIAAFVDRIRVFRVPSIIRRRAATTVGLPGVVLVVTRVPTALGALVRRRS